MCGSLLHVGPGAAATLQSVPEPALPPEGADLAILDIAELAGAAAGSVRVRDDVRVPVMTVVSETDVLGATSCLGARQPDTDRFRLWEIAGAAHTSTYGLCAAVIDSGAASIMDLAASLAPISEFMGMQCDVPINAGVHHHYVVQAAIAHLDRWVRGGTPPPTAERLQVATTEPPAFEVDNYGIARGGVRTPWVDVPTAVLSGLGQAGDSFAFLFGSTRPFDSETLAAVYPGGRDDYTTRFGAATDAAIESGFLLSEDAEEMRALATAMYPAA